MTRTRRLPPTPISHIETHHAYTSPPLSEKGGLPTIIVTPSNPVSPQDFQIHFFSTEMSEKRRSEGFGLGLRRWFSYRRPISFMTSDAEKEPYAQYAYSPIPTEDDARSNIVRDDAMVTEDSQVVGYTSPLWQETEHSPKRFSFATRGRRLRILLFLTIPLILLIIHLIGYRLGVFGNMADRLVGNDLNHSAEMYIVDDDVTGTVPQQWTLVDTEADTVTYNTGS